MRTLLICKDCGRAKLTAMWFDIKVPPGQLVEKALCPECLVKRQEVESKIVQQDNLFATVR